MHIHIYPHFDAVGPARLQRLDSQDVRR